MRIDQDRIDQAKAVPLLELASRLGIEGLRRAGGLEHVGPCPVCGGRDRFSIRPLDGVWNCRHCRGGDGIALVQHVQGIDFGPALDWILGTAVREETPAEREKRLARAEADAKRRDREAADHRARAIRLARKLWGAAERDGAGTIAEAYLARRGIRLPSWPPSLRFDPAAKYMVRRGGERLVLHEGPALVAAIQAPDRAISGVHRTWIDLDQPKGKAQIINPATGVLEPSKLVHGSKKGGAIRFGPALPSMVVAEGIETTLTGLVADPLKGAAYWCAVDLGNIAGRMAKLPGRRWSGEPDLSDLDAFVPPPEVRRLVLIEDGDSDDQKTRAQLEAGARRAMALRPGLRAFIWPAGAGRDLNDILMRGGADDAGHRVEQTD